MSDHSVDSVKLPASDKITAMCPWFLLGKAHYSDVWCCLLVVAPWKLQEIIRLKLYCLLGKLRGFSSSSKASYLFFFLKCIFIYLCYIKWVKFFNSWLLKLGVCVWSKMLSCLICFSYKLAEAFKAEHWLVLQKSVLSFCSETLKLSFPQALTILCFESKTHCLTLKSVPRTVMCPVISNSVLRKWLWEARHTPAQRSHKNESAFSGLMLSSWHRTHGSTGVYLKLRASGDFYALNLESEFSLKSDKNSDLACTLYLLFFLFRWHYS